MNLFYKMHANGNDFMIIDAFNYSIPLSSLAIIHRWADRHTGVGFDQLLYLTHETRPFEFDVACRIFNASGSEAEQCGHGMACLAQLLYRRGDAPRTHYRIKVPAGICNVQRLDEKRSLVDLGYPIVHPITRATSRKQPGFLCPLSLPKEIELASKQVIHEIWSTQQKLLVGVSDDAISKLLQHVSASMSFFIGVIRLGNPHYVVLVPNIDTAPMGLARYISEYPIFPHGSNVEFMQIVNLNYIRLRTYERGVGENRACGSGACASVVFGRLLGLLNPEVTVEFYGGAQVKVGWAHTRATVYLETSTQFIFQGELLEDI